MSEQNIDPTVRRGSTARVIYRRAADTIYVGAALIAAFWAYTQWTQLPQTAEAPLALRDVQFTAAGPMNLEIATDRYRARRSDLAAALSASGATGAALDALADSDTYFNLLEHAGSDFILEKQHEARADLAVLRRAANGDTGPVTRALVAVEQARIDYYGQLLDHRAHATQ